MALAPVTMLNVTDGDVTTTKVNEWVCLCPAFAVVNATDVHGLSFLLRSWWRRDLDSFSALPALCEGNPPVTGGFPLQRASKAGFDVFFCFFFV